MHQKKVYKTFKIKNILKCGIHYGPLFLNQSYA